MCRDFSCVVGRWCLLWPVLSLSKTLLAFALLHSVLQGQTCLLFQVYLDFLLLHFSPCDDFLHSFPHRSVGKESICNAGDPCSIAGSGRSSGEGKGYPLQYSGLENSLDCMYSPWGSKELDMTEQLSLSLSPMMKRAALFGISSRRSCTSSQSCSISVSSALVVGA